MHHVGMGYGAKYFFAAASEQADIGSRDNYQLRGPLHGRGNKSGSKVLSDFSLQATSESLETSPLIAAHTKAPFGSKMA